MGLTRQAIVLETPCAQGRMTRSAITQPLSFDPVSFALVAWNTGSVHGLSKRTGAVKANAAVCHATEEHILLVAVCADFRIGDGPGLIGRVTHIT